MKLNCFIQIQVLLLSNQMLLFCSDFYYKLKAVYKEHGFKNKIPTDRANVSSLRFLFSFISLGFDYLQDECAIFN